jgi:hypothetical protein
MIQSRNILVIDIQTRLARFKYLKYSTQKYIPTGPEDRWSRACRMICSSLVPHALNMTANFTFLHLGPIFSWVHIDLSQLMRRYVLETVGQANTLSK